MNEFFPIVVAVPSQRRDRLRRSDVLPQHLLREINLEQLWEQNSSPSVYLWPFDIPYSETDKLRKIVEERVADVPAFFGMDTENPEEPKDHQERLVTQVLFGSVLVHILFLDNRETDTTPGSRERNETYARFSTSFKDVIHWSHNLNEVLKIRFPASKTSPRQILVLISPEEQVVASREEIEELNEMIGENKTFQSCYFLDLNLKPEASRAVFHSEYIWDVLIGRFLLALVLSQEKNEKDNVTRKPLWEYAGIKVWRASDCIFSVPQESGYRLEAEMEKAVKKLKELICQSEGELQSKLLREVPAPETFVDFLQPSWEGEMPDYAEWGIREGFSANSFWRNWSDLQVSDYVQQIRAPEHWKESFDRLSGKRIEWSKKHLPLDYTPDINNFFASVRWNPGFLWDFIDQLVSRPNLATEAGESSRAWNTVAAAENLRRGKIRQLTNDSRDFKKAQDHYIGRGMAILVMASVTVFTGWTIWQVLSLIGVGISKILLLSCMVFAGSAVACILVILLHNFAGTRAAKAIMVECEGADEAMKRRDELVRKMFFDGIRKRNVLTLQSVRFKTRRLAERIRFMLVTELQPRLSSLLEITDTADPQPESADTSDPYRVRDAYLKSTRTSIGSLQIDIVTLDDKFLETRIRGSETEQKSFSALWEDLCSIDQRETGYFPSRMFISRIRSFVADFLAETYHYLFKQSIRNSEKLEQVLKTFTKQAHTMKDGSLLSASLSKYTGSQRRILFINSSLFDFRYQGADVKKAKMRECPSNVLETTHTAALFYQEYDVEFDLINQKQDSRTKDPDHQVLTFKSVVRGDA